MKISEQFDYAEQAPDAFNSTPVCEFTMICIQTTIQNILHELSFPFQERSKKKKLTVITPNSFNQAELKRKTGNHMPIYTTLVITLPSVEGAYCKYCCYETHHCL